jgi:hypothetical protein
MPVLETASTKYTSTSARTPSQSRATSESWRPSGDADQAVDAVLGREDLADEAQRRRNSLDGQDAPTRKNCGSDVAMKSTTAVSRWRTQAPTACPMKLVARRSVAANGTGPADGQPR